MTTKAQVLTQINQPLTLQDIDLPSPKQGEVVVDVKAAALNHRDIFITKGLYPGITFPCVMGSDGVGEYKGQTFILNPNHDWGTDERVQSKGYHILGSPTYGTFAEQVVVGKDKLHIKPDHLTIEQAAALPLAGLTAYRAVFSRGRLKAGEKVLISGIGGGVALFACQFAIAVGAEVWVTSSKPEKIEKATELGAKGGALYTNEGWEKALKRGGGGFDLIIDSAGGSGFNDLINIANPAGRISIYGGTRGKMTISPQKLFWKQLDILGSTMGSDQDFTDMVAFVNSHKIVPVVDAVYPLGQLNEALERMDKGLQFGKIVVRM